MFYIELEPVFNNEGVTQPLDFQLDMSGYEFNGDHSFDKPVHVIGEIKNTAGIVSLLVSAKFTLNLTCDRCAKEFSCTFSVPCEHVLVTELNDENNDELIVVDSMHYNVQPLIIEDIFLSLPTKVLCREDCLGICHRCGKDLNEGPCDCEKEIDPRWDALLQFTEDE